MNRRILITGAALGIIPRQAMAEPFPLPPKPNPCGEPFIRQREEEPDYAKQFHDDLVVWSYDHQNITTAWVGLNPEVKDLMPPGGVLDIGGITFRVSEAPNGLMPETDLWFVISDCGELI